MIQSLLITGLKGVAGLLLIYFLILVVLHIHTVFRLRFYANQGAVVFPGAHRFFFGNSLDLREYVKVRAGPQVVRGH